MLVTFFKGFTTSAGLIIAIGAQNAFVIRQGLLKRHLFLTAFLSSLIDALLITLGVMGFGTLISDYPLFIPIAKYFAILFLLFYGALSLKSAFKPRTLNPQEQPHTSLKKTVLLLLALSLLNPHVYLDTVILLGSIASQHSHKHHFACGAILASFSWFFTITYGSRYLAPLLQTPKAWRVIDGCVAVMMWAIAGMLIESIQ